MHRLLEEDSATAIPAGTFKHTYEKGRANRSNRKKRQQDAAAVALEQGQKRLAEDKRKFEEERKKFEGEVEEGRKMFDEREKAQAKRVKKGELELSTRAEQLDRKEANVYNMYAKLGAQTARANQAYGPALEQRRFGQ